MGILSDLLLAATEPIAVKQTSLNQQRGRIPEGVLPRSGD